MMSRDREPLNALIDVVLQKQKQQRENLFTQELEIPSRAFKVPLLKLFRTNEKKEKTFSRTLAFIELSAT
jgi:hypothetical protein